MWELQQATQHSSWKHSRQMCSYGECSCLRQLQQAFILDRITWRTWRSTRTRTSRNSELIQYHTEIKIGAFWRNSEFEYDWQCISVPRSSDLAEKSKGTCLLRFRSMLGKADWQQLQDAKVKWKNPNFPLRCKELLGIDGEAIEFEWNIFAGFSSLQIR